MKYHENEIANYISWLEFKKLQHIVRYYPTFNMYLLYRDFAYYNGLYAFGQYQDPEVAYKNLIIYLRDRLNQ